MNNADYFDSNNCGQSCHYFARDSEDAIQAYHVGDDSLCESAEFRFTQMLEGDVDGVHTCPWCLKKNASEDHIRKCSDYVPASTREEICDAYSDPTDHAKRDSLLREIER